MSRFSAGLFVGVGLLLSSQTAQAQCQYLGGYPWKEGGCLVSKDLNDAIAGRNPLLNVPPKTSEFAYGFDNGMPLYRRPSFKDLSGTLEPVQIPRPTTTSFGGVLSYISPGSQVLYGITNAGQPVSRQLSLGELTGSISPEQIPKPTATTLGGVLAEPVTPTWFLTGLDTNGNFSSRRPLFTDLGDTIAASQQILPTSATLGSVFASPAVTGQYLTGIGVDGKVTSAPAAVVDPKNHLRVSGTTGTVAGCGGSPIRAGADTAGRVTIGSGNPTGCTINFVQTYTAIPFCTVTWNSTTPTTRNYVVSTSSITLTMAGTTSGVNVYWVCLADVNG